MRVVDAHGHALSKSTGVGHCGWQHHNAMEDALSGSACSAGINAVQQLKAICINDVEHRRRRAFEKNSDVNS